MRVCVCACVRVCILRFKLAVVHVSPYCNYLYSDLFFLSEET